MIWSVEGGMTLGTRFLKANTKWCESEFAQTAKKSDIRRLALREGESGELGATRAG